MSDSRCHCLRQALRDVRIGMPKGQFGISCGIPHHMYPRGKMDDSVHPLDNVFEIGKLCQITRGPGFYSVPRRRLIAEGTNDPAPGRRQATTKRIAHKTAGTSDDYFHQHPLPTDGFGVTRAIGVGTPEQ